MSLLSSCATCSTSIAAPASAGPQRPAAWRRAAPRCSRGCRPRSPRCRRWCRRCRARRRWALALHFCQSWMKIQVLDESSASAEIHPLQGRPVYEPPKLTDRQQQILDLVQSAIERTGAPPTRAEIATELGFKSANAAEEHLQALARKGVIELVGGTSRGIRLRSETLRQLNLPRGKQFSLPLPSLAQLTLPLVGRVAAGSPILAQEHIDQTYLMEASMFPRRPDYLLKVRGMSMRDAGIMDGDLLAVQRTKEAKNGQIVVARLGDEVTVKRFRRTRHQHRADPREPRLPDHRRADQRRRCRRGSVRARRPGRRPDPQQHADVRGTCMADQVAQGRHRGRVPDARAVAQHRPVAGRGLAQHRHHAALPTCAARTRSCSTRSSAPPPASARTRACSTPSWPPPISCAAPRPRRVAGTRDAGAPAHRLHARAPGPRAPWRHIHRAAQGLVRLVGPMPERHVRRGACGPAGEGRPGARPAADQPLGAPR